MANSFRIIIYILPFMLISCMQAPSLSPEEFVSYVDNKENGYLVTEQLRDVIFSAKYEPLEYKAIKDLVNTDSAITESSFMAFKNEAKGFCYFVFRIESATGSKNPLKALARTQEDEAKLFKYTQTLMQDDFYLEAGSKKIPCAIYHMEGDYDMLNYSLVSLAFDASGIDASADLTLVYNDQVFQNGPLKFTISKHALTHLPHIKLLL